MENWMKSELNKTTLQVIADTKKVLFESGEKLKEVEKSLGIVKKYINGRE